MNDYYSVRIDVSPCTPDITDLAAAFMADAGFESFEPDVTGLTAYIRAEGTDPDGVARQALAGFPTSSRRSWRARTGTPNGKNIISGL